MNKKETSELAQGLQNSNVREVAGLAKAYLALELAYDELLLRHTRMTADEVMRKHGVLLKRLASSEEE